MLKPGDLLAGDFEIEAQLGHGGMGAVFRARQRSTDTTRAIKVMLPEWAGNASLRERFEREARASGKIRSDHVVKVIAYGVDPERHIPWIAMEYLTGTTLEDCVAQGSLSRSVIVELLRQFFHAVAAAHAVGVVHRDLKPPNIFVSRSERPDVPFTVKVLDFGIAKVLSADPTTTQAMGTRLWMAPEQGESRAIIGPSADVWAIGLVVFWLLTGKLFWRNAERSDIDLLHEIYFMNPMPSSRQRLAELLLPDLGADFDGWVSRCLQRDPKARFPDAGAAWAALEPILRAMPPESTTQLAGKTASRASEPSGARKTAGSSLPRGRGTSSPIVLEGQPPTLRRRGVFAWTLAAVAGGVAAAVALALGLHARTPIASPGGPAAATALPSADVRGAAPVPSSAVQLAPSAAAAPTLPTAAAPSPPQGMIYVPPGTFEMGAAGPEPNGPAHPVEITHGFFLDGLEVTAGEYDACVRARACSPSGVHGPSVTPDEVPRFSNYCNGQKPGRELHPINCVDNQQAADYCRSRSKRLPTEAEWEYAARGTDGRAYPWGNDLPATCDVAVVSGLCPARGTQPVGTRSASSASAFGALDMAGNVWEWVADVWDPRAYRVAPKRNPLTSGASQLGVLRGGSWDFVRDTAASTYRLKFDRRTGHVSSGVRCARSAGWTG